MIFVVVGEARPSATLQQIQANRLAYVDWEPGTPHAGKYETLARYEVVGASPKRTFWVMQADDPAVIHGLVEHFADVWQITTYPVVQRTIGEAA
ncbi:MAG: hypothetical protein IT318_08755 [Anaerolineales bacterium]|nr:hypothetical protein [Anaerolineales bacterium]